MIIFGISASGQKTDVLIMLNNDIITGEIKKLEYGILTYSTDDAGTIEVKWDKVIELRSGNYFEIETQQGEEFFGSLKTPKEPGMIKISPDSLNSFQIKIADIIRITPIKMRFWNRLDGSISLGFNYTKASNIAQLNYNLSTSYRTRKISNEIKLNGNTTYGIRQEAEEKENAIRQDISNSFTRYLKNKWYIGAYLTVQKNTEMGLDRRLMIGTGGGNYLIQTNRHELGLLLGLVGMREWLSGEDPTQTNMEGFLNMSYSLYKYDSPKSNITITGRLFPGLTDWGRIRADINLGLKQEVIKDFFVSINYYETYDSKPGEDASKNDRGIITSIGYSW